MIVTFRGAVIAAFAVFVTGTAAGQSAPIVSLMPAEPERWEAAGYVGWLGNTSDVAPDRTDWYGSASAGGSVGYYFTPHLKIELDLATTTEGEVYEYEQIQMPGETFPYFRSRTHHYRNTSVSGGAAYQFFENRWFHPFVGAGIDVVRERDRIDASTQGPPPRNPAAPIVIPPWPASTVVSYTGRPFASGGFKWYMTERAFVRSDLRVSFSPAGAQSVTWRAGVGVDF